MKKQTSKKGFTLIELIVVLAILAIVMTIAIPTAFGAIENARVAADKATVDGLNSAIRVAASLRQADTLANKKALDIGTALMEGGFQNGVTFQSNGGTAGADWVIRSEDGQIGMLVYNKNGSNCQIEGSMSNIQLSENKKAVYYFK